MRLRPAGLPVVALKRKRPEDFSPDPGFKKGLSSLFKSGN
jgi:hypothetical protein